MKLKPEIKNNPNVRSIVITVRVNAEEMRNLLTKAALYTKRDVSKWLRFSALKHKPRKEDLE